MKDNEKDIFEINQSTKRVAENCDFVNASPNFFLKTSMPNIFNRLNGQEESYRRLNDYDLNLLEEDAYKDVDDDILKIEYKISKIEEELKLLSSQIMAAVDISDYHSIESLNKRKVLLENEYQDLMATYKNKSVSAHMTSKMTNFIGSKFRKSFLGVANKLSATLEIFLSALPEPFSSTIKLKKSLNKLENINRSVDELITLKIPYGESYNKYDQLSKYIIKANSIQTEIKRHIEK